MREGKAERVLSSNSTRIMPFIFSSLNHAPLTSMTVAIKLVTSIY